MVRKVQLLLLSSPLVRAYPAVRRAWQISHYLPRRPITHAEDFAAFARFPVRRGLFLDVDLDERRAEVEIVEWKDLSRHLLHVEGSELLVLRGLAATLESCHPIVLVERSRDVEAIQQLLKAGGYSAYSYRADVGRFVPFASLQAGPNVFFMRPDALPRDAVER
jgi:hypothetical protein